MPARDQLSRLVQGAIHLIYPPICMTCGTPMLPGAVDFCEPCRSALLHDPAESCKRCAASVGPGLGRLSDCARCRGEPFRFERVIRLGPYEGRLREVILNMKHRRYEGLSEAVGALWVGRDLGLLEGERIGAVVPVPLHWRRHWSRGYNQAETLARSWASALGVPLFARGLRRVKATALQPLVPKSARSENVRGAFAARAKFDGLSVLLVDDVLTTGATANEVSRALKAAGAARVVVAACGRS